MRTPPSHPHVTGGRRILLLSENRDTAAKLARAIPEREARLTVEATSLREVNGRASALVAGHDLVILETSGLEADDLAAVSDVAAGRSSESVLMAVAPEGLSIAGAHRLRDAGIAEVLPNTATAEELRRTVTALLARSATVGPQHRAGSLIAVAKSRGGVGASTVAVNLACALAGKEGWLRRGKRRRVALVDFDLQFGCLATLLDVDPGEGLMRLIDAECPDPLLVAAALQPHGAGLQVLAAPLPLVPLTAITQETVAGIIDALQAEHDCVVVDLPQALVDWVGPILRRATAMVLVTDTSVPAIRQAKRLTDFFAEDHPDLKIEMVINRESRPFLKSSQVRAAEQALGQPLGHWWPDSPKQARRAADAGRPILDLYPSSKLSRAARKLASLLAEPATAEKTLTK